MSEIPRRTVLAGSAAVVAAGVLTAAPAAAGSAPGPKPTVVLVHGAFADASGWNEVTRPTGNAGVRALVYVAAFAPAAGDTVAGLQNRFPGTKLHEEQLDFRANGAGYDAYVKREVFRDIFAGDLPRSTTDLMWATQRPGATNTLGEPAGAPAWAQVPSWYLVARDDNLIPAAAQRFMAQRAGSRTVEVRASHVAMISQPRVTADLIALAARTTSKGA